VKFPVEAAPPTVGGGPPTMKSPTISFSIIINSHAAYKPGPSRTSPLTLLLIQYLFSFCLLVLYHTSISQPFGFLIITFIVYMTY